MKHISSLFFFTAVLLLNNSVHAVLTPQQELGRLIFFDTTLSEPTGQACVSCHNPQHAFSDPDKHLPVSEGVTPGHFGNRNTPTAMYAAFTPAFHYDAEEGLYVGGLFHDGRAATLVEQAKDPFLNPVEMGNPDSAAVVAKVKKAPYADLFRKVYGEHAFKDAERAYHLIAEALVAFQQTEQFAPFNSKYDAYLAGKVELSAQEKLGLEVFEAEDKGNCAACHPSRPDEKGHPPLFTDYTYDNVGVPKNTESPFLKLTAPFNPAGADFIDLGLGAAEQVGKAEENGKFKVPTLRNIARTAPYMHNGVFSELSKVLEFYNTRDTDKKWGKAEVVENVNTEELGDLKLSREELEALEAFLLTLNDGYIID